MKIFGLAGWSNSGKTTLLTGLVRVLTARGLRVSTVKHAHHRFDMDQPGKDSHRHREAGATEVLVTSGARWALLHELREEEEPGLDDLLPRMTAVDLVLIEGFKRHPHAKLEVFRPALGKEPLWPGDPTIVAVASDADVDGLDRPRLDLDDAEVVADFILDYLGLSGSI